MSKDFFGDVFMKKVSFISVLLCIIAISVLFAGCSRYDKLYDNACEKAMSAKL